MARLVILLWLYATCPTIQGDATAEFSSVADQFWTWNLEQSPELATALGNNNYNDKLETFNLTMFPARKARVDGFYTTLQNIRKEDLSKENQYNYDFLLDKIRTYAEGYAWRKFGALNPISFLSGLHIGLENLLTAPFKTKMDFENLITRITLINTRVAEYTELCRKAVRLTRTHNIASMAKVPGQIETMLTADPTQFVLYRPFTGTLENVITISAADKQDLRTRAAAAIDVNVLEPFRVFKTFLENDYMPHCRPAAGVGTWDQGREYYMACLKWHLSLDITPEEIHTKGLEEVSRIKQEMTKVMRSQNFQGTIPEYFNSLRSDDRFKLPSSEAIIEEYKDIIFQRINPKLNSLFSTIPNVPLSVEAMPYDGVSAIYGPGVFYANVMRPTETFTFEMIPKALHEANPGHHLQFSYQWEKPLPPYRQIYSANYFQIPFAFPEYTAYVEGWALYAEALGEEMNVYKDQYELMGRYSSEMLQACGLVVDTGMHVMGWTREDAILYVENHTSYGRSEIENHVDRYITWPGHACAYKIGELKIWELRQKAETELGEKFDLKEFHATILDTGDAPLRLVEQIVNRMIERVQSKQSQGNTDQTSNVIIFSALAVVTTLIIASRRLISTFSFIC